MEQMREEEVRTPTIITVTATEFQNNFRGRGFGRCAQDNKIVDTVLYLILKQSGERVKVDRFVGLERRNESNAHALKVKSGHKGGGRIGIFGSYCKINHYRSNSK